MPSFTVYFNVPGSVSVQVDEAEDADAAIEQACGELYVGLCHACARDLDLGDPEPFMVTNESGDVAWENRSM